MRKYRVMMVGADGMLRRVSPVVQTVFDNAYDAETLAYELSKATGNNYTVSPLWEGQERENDKKAPPDKPAREGQDQGEFAVEEIKEQLVGALYRITAQLLKEEPVPANLDKIEQIRRNTDTIIRLMDYMT